MSGKRMRVLEGLKNPRGGMKAGSDHYVATSTKSGEVVEGYRDNQTRYSLKNLGGKPKELGDFEWIQNAKLDQKNYIAIDSNRNAFVIFNPSSQLISKIKFDPNWAIQDLVVSHLSEQQKSFIQKIEN